MLSSIICSVVYFHVYYNYFWLFKSFVVVLNGQWQCPAKTVPNLTLFQSTEISNNIYVADSRCIKSSSQQEINVKPAFSIHNEIFGKQYPPVGFGDLLFLSVDITKPNSFSVKYKNLHLPLSRWTVLIFHILLCHFPVYNNVSMAK